MSSVHNKTHDSDKKQNQDSNIAKIKDLETKLARALADYQNLEKRFSKEAQDIIRFANKNIIIEILKIKDNLERASKVIKDKGLDMILNQLNDLLKTENVTEIKALGQTFNPETMEADSIVNGEKDKVVEVVSKGYMLYDRILRPVKVKVGAGIQKQQSKKQ